ncbi:MAG: ABC transporter substrate-binding protein [Chloroflexi bacterium]|nr:ABC transporter substrate-binding protein [Chloroflexota bacterium]
MFAVTKSTPVVFLTAFGLLLASCAPAAAPPPQPTQPLAKPATSPEAKGAAPAATPKPTAGQPRYGGVLTKVSPADPPMLDLALNTTMLIFENVGSVYNGLFQYDPLQNDKIVNDLVEMWETSPDGKVYTFTLKSGVKWHDGRPFTAEDAAFTLTRDKFDKASQLKDYTGSLQKAEAVDASTLKVTLESPWSAFIANLAIGYLIIVPKHVVQAKGDLRTTAVGTGPFKLKEYAQGVGSDLVKNPDYFVEGRPYLDGLKVFIVKDDGARFAAFRTGQIKLTGVGSGALKPGQANLVRNNMRDKASVMVSPSLQFPAFIMQTRNKPWDDVRVRQAVNLAVDRGTAVKVLEEGEGDIGTVPGIVPKSEWIIPEAEMMQMPGFRSPKDQDIAQARKLMADAGFPNGLKTKTLTRAGSTPMINTAQFFKDQLAKIGIEVEIDPRESAVYLERRGRFAYETLAATATTVMVDPDGASKYFGADNIYGFKDEQTFQIFDKQRATLDMNERKKLVIELQRRGLELSPFVVAGWGFNRVGVWNEVRNYKPPIGNYNNHKFADVWLAR